jgi:hypothetical protein
LPLANEVPQKDGECCETDEATQSKTRDKPNVGTTIPRLERGSP